MKKLLVILMVVAMASFLFVGCLPGVTPPADDVDDEDEPPVAVVTEAEAIAAVKDAAVVLSSGVGALDAEDVVTFLEALADANFTGYVAVNDNAYVAAAVAGNFDIITTVALVNTAITAVNTAVTAAAAAAVAAAAVAAVNAATTSAALNTALANAAFTGYIAANSNECFTSIALFSAVLTPSVAAVNAVILIINAAALTPPTVAYATTGNDNALPAAGETLILTFSRSMIPITITAVNIDTVLLPSAGTHLDGAGAIGSAVWSLGDTVLTITYTAGTAIPTITTGTTFTATGFASAAGVALPVAASAALIATDF